MGVLDQVKREVKNSLLGIQGSHDWEHTERVYKLAMHIGEKENADMEIVQLAAILHDIARPIQDKSKGEICHAEKGAELAKSILEKYNLEKEKIDNIVHCIQTHRFRNNNIPQTKEAKVVFDADKIDSIGAIGIGRTFHFAGEIGAKIHNKDVDIENTKEYSEDDTGYREFMVKLSKIKDKVITEEGKRLAEERHEFMVEFFDGLNKEVDGII